MSKVRSFEKLFRKADDVAGVHHCKSLAQEDIGVLDSIYDEDSVKKAQKPDQFDIETMRSISQQVVLPTEYDSVFVGLYQEQNHHKKAKAVPLPHVLGSWENEVEELYGNNNHSSMESKSAHSSSSTTANHKNLTTSSILDSNLLNAVVGGNKINKNNENIPQSFSRYFDGDILSDLDEVEDPFDTIIPNGDEIDSTPQQDEEFTKFLNFGLPASIATLAAANATAAAQQPSTDLFANRSSTPTPGEPTHKTSTSSSSTSTVLVPLATKKKLFGRFTAASIARSTANAASAAKTEDDQLASNNNPDPAVPTSTATPGTKAADTADRRQQRQQQKIAEANLTRHELIALKRKQKADRLKGVNPYFDPTVSLRDSRQNRSSVAAGSVSFREYHSGLVNSLNHALINSQHLSTKPDLTEAELKHFHRPRMTRKDLTRSWQISLINNNHSNSSNGNISSNSRNGSKHRNAQTYARGRQHQRHQTLALAPHSSHSQNHVAAAAADAAASTFILVEYSEEFPPLMQNYGMASLLVNFYRPSKGQGNNVEDDDVANTNSNGNNSEAERKAEEEASLQRMSSLLARHKLRLPQHVSQLWRLQHNQEQRSRYDHDADIPRLELGQTKLLNPEDETPFLGWDEKDTLQPALINRLFRTPLFPQQVRSTDFLLVRSRVGRDGFEYLLREIPFIFCAGQVEPLRLVPRPPVPVPAAGPFSITILPSQRLHYALSIARILKTSDNGVLLADLEKAVLKYSYDSKRAPHRAAHRDYVVDLATRVLGEYRLVTAADKNNASDANNDGKGKDQLLLFLREEVLAQPPPGEESLFGSQTDAAPGVAGAGVSSTSAGSASGLTLGQRVTRVLEKYFPFNGSYGALYNYHPERLVQSFEAEDVCVVEASSAAEYRMRSQHLLPVDVGFLQHYLHFHSRMKEQYKVLMERVGGKSSSNTNSSSNGNSSEALSFGGLAAQQLACRRVLQQLLKRTERHYNIARHVYESLVHMPWHSSESFVSCVVDRSLNTAALFFDASHVANSAINNGASSGSAAAATTTSEAAAISPLQALRALHGINAPFASMPVGCLMHFPYHSNHPQQPRVLDIQGLGDPSGLGEAFALKRFVHINSRDVALQLWQQLREFYQQNNNNSGSNGGSKKEDKGLYGTDKDLRRLTKAEAIVMLISFGVDRAKAVAMPRWDRIHVIRAFVQQAEKEGRSISTWMKYLRDERASSGGGFGLRRARRQGVHEFGRFSSKENMQAVCREIWRRQSLSLSSEDWRQSRDKPLSLEAQRRLRRKQRREAQLLLQQHAYQRQQQASTASSIWKKKITNRIATTDNTATFGADAEMVEVEAEEEVDEQGVSRNQVDEEEVWEDEEDEDDDLALERQQRRLQELEDAANAAASTQQTQDADGTDAQPVDPKVAERARKREMRRLKRLKIQRRKQREKMGLPAESDEEEDKTAAKDDDNDGAEDNTNNDSSEAVVTSTTNDESRKRSFSTMEEDDKQNNNANANANNDEDKEDEDDDEDISAMLKKRVQPPSANNNSNTSRNFVVSSSSSSNTNTSSGAISKAKRARITTDDNSEDEDEDDHRHHDFDENAQKQPKANTNKHKHNAIMSAAHSQQESIAAAAAAEYEALRAHNLSILASMPRPQKVVRRIQRVYTADGRITTTVHFSFDTTDVLRVEQMQATQQTLRINRRLDAQKMEMHVLRRMRALQQASPQHSQPLQLQQHQQHASVYVPGQGLMAQVYAVDDYAEEFGGGSTLVGGHGGRRGSHSGGLVGSSLGGALSINLQRLNQHQYDGEDVAVGGAGGGRGRRGRASHSHHVMGSPGSDDQAGYYYGADDGDDVPVGEEDLERLHQSMTSSRRHKTVSERVQNTRLPQVALAAMLETEIMTLWNAPIAELFRYPVDTKLLPNYAVAITQPISLNDIRQKIVSYRYSSSREVLADVELMAKNAERFNGESHDVAKKGRKLFSMLKSNLEHHQRIFGVHQDIYAHLEMQIVKQRAAEAARLETQEGKEA